MIELIMPTIDPGAFNKYGVTEPSVIITWEMLYEFTIIIYLAGIASAMIFDEIIKRYRGHKHE